MRYALVTAEHVSQYSLKMNCMQFLHPPPVFASPHLGQSIEQSATKTRNLTSRVRGLILHVGCFERVGEIQQRGGLAPEDGGIGHR